LREEVEKWSASVLIGRQKWEEIETEYETGGLGLHREEGGILDEDRPAIAPLVKY
jgi:hypothetical protein